ncbi:MAG: HupU protein [Pseudomonadales bacterium]|nr:HupU protein [Pseudomonadales bacterium]
MTRKTLPWLQSGGCGGCSLSLLNAETPHLLARLQQANIELLWHPSVSEVNGPELIRLLNAIVDGDTALDILCLEASAMLGPNGSGRFHMLSGTDEPMFQWIQKLASRAKQVVAVGSCAAFGGITAAGSNLVEAIGLQYDRSQRGGLLGEQWQGADRLPVVNIAGCPTHPDWVTETLTLLAADALASDDLDEYQRPRFYTDHLVHHGCPRNEYYEYKASAETAGDLGCMMEHMGCLGTQARADCNIRPWNGEGSCLKGGYACVNCTAPGFEEPRHSFVETPKLAGIPVGLPTDMPKAWFVALASLAKAATPERLRRNAVAERLIYPPGRGVKKRE